MSRSYRVRYDASRATGGLGVILGLAAGLALGCADEQRSPTGFDVQPGDPASGQRVFRFETFGDEAHWTDTLRMHEVIQAAVDPTTALSVGLKVDADALTPGLLASADLTDPATSVALIGLDAVVGLKGTVDDQGQLTRIGVTCALCHSTVDDSVMAGIGKRLDGYANRDLNPGAILALSPAFDEAEKAVLNGWGPGRFDPRWNLDGIDGAVLIPPAYGLADVPLATYTGDGPVAYWNAYVAVNEMGGEGTFHDDRIGVDVTHTPDLVAPHLSDLLAYELSLKPPAPPAESFDQQAAARGRTVFEGKARCASCHPAPTYTSAALHAPKDTGMDGQYAQRSATKKYRATPLRGAWQHPPYFHGGSAADLAAVVDHYDTTLSLDLSQGEKGDLVELLKSL